MQLIDNVNITPLLMAFNKFDYGFFLFGSRITNKAKKFSD